MFHQSARPKWLAGLLLAFAVVFGAGETLAAQNAGAGQFLFVWAGSRTGAPGSAPANAMVVIDADRGSPTYGRLVSWTKTDAPSTRVHHTEYWMPEGGVLFANDHDAGRTFRIDLRDPAHPTILGSFETMGPLAMPHSFMRTPSGSVLATFMHENDQSHGAAQGHGSHAPGSAAWPWITGGLAEIDPDGRMIRTASNADPAFEGELLSPYGLVILPEIDRVLSTNSAMKGTNGPGSTFQVWRLSTLELLSTERFDPGPSGLSHIDPEEPRVGPDGSVYVQTLSCSLQRVTGLAEDRPRARFVHRFGGAGCGVPTIVGRWLIQSVPYLNALVVLDLADPDAIREVSRLLLPDGFSPHWTGWDTAGSRVVTTGSSRVYLLDLDQGTGRLTLDQRFGDGEGVAGFDFSTADWPFSAEGRYVPHGAVFSR